MSTSHLPVAFDKESFDKLFIALYPRLTAYATLFLESDVAEDVVQELFVYLWEHSGKLFIHSSLEAYLFKSVYLRCLNQIKQRKMKDTYHRQVEERLTAIEQQAFDPEMNDPVRQLFLSELKQDMRQAISGLPERCREVFMMSYIYQLKNKEIAEILNISVNTVENHMTSALKTLRTKLKKYILVLGCFYPCELLLKSIII